MSDRANAEKFERKLRQQTGGVVHKFESAAENLNHASTGLQHFTELLHHLHIVFNAFHFLAKLLPPLRVFFAAFASLMEMFNQFYIQEDNSTQKKTIRVGLSLAILGIVVVSVMFPVIAAFVIIGLTVAEVGKELYELYEKFAQYNFLSDKIQNKIDALTLKIQNSDNPAEVKRCAERIYDLQQRQAKVKKSMVLKTSDVLFAAVGVAGAIMAVIPGVNVIGLGILVGAVVGALAVKAVDKVGSWIYNKLFNSPEKRALAKDKAVRNIMKHSWQPGCRQRIQSMPVASASVKQACRVESAAKPNRKRHLTAALVAGALATAPMAQADSENKIDPVTNTEVRLVENKRSREEDDKQRFNPKPEPIKTSRRHKEKLAVSKAVHDLMSDAQFDLPMAKEATPRTCAEEAHSGLTHRRARCMSLGA